MNFNKIYVFTDFDLDGVASLLMLHWGLGAKPGQLPFKATTVSNFRREYLNWLNENKPSDFDKIFILDLDVSNSVDLIDLKNVTVIDHHLTHVKAIAEYKNAKLNIVETSSCAKLIYNVLKDKINLTPEQKYFIGLADDYDSYQFKLKETYELNSLYTNTQKKDNKPRAQIFLEKYYDGFKPFTSQEKAIIKDHVSRRDSAIKSLQMFKGTVSIGGKDRTILGTSGNKFVNEICDYVIRTQNADIVFFVNTDNQHVSFRKNKSCEIDLSKLAAKLCEGGGHEYAAGGKITEGFLNFTKLLSPI